jgi:hypothetical protein
MKKIFQKFDILLPAAPGGSVNISERLRDDYALCTGFFIVKNEQSAKSELQLKIGGVEIIPTGSDTDLFVFNGSVGREESIYDFKADKITARSSDVEIFLKNKHNVACTYSFYFVLEND